MPCVFNRNTVRALGLSSAWIRIHPVLTVASSAGHTSNLMPVSKRVATQIPPHTVADWEIMFIRFCFAANPSVNAGFYKPLQG